MGAAPWKFQKRSHEMNYVKLLRKDTGLEEAAEIKTAMMDSEGWRYRARRTDRVR